MRVRYIVAGSALLLAAVVVALGFYVSSVFNTPAPQRTPGLHYLVSLGDSVAAGDGLNSASDSGACDVSSEAYPALLASQLHESLKQVACSGAVVMAGSNSLLTTQFPQVQPFLAGSDVIITAGANDIDWLQALKSCAQSNCQSLDTPELNAKLAALQTNLTQLLHELQQAKPRKVVINTYYSLLEPSDTCYASFGITPAKIAVVSAEQDRLNGAIASSAKATGATIVDIDFSGHLLCSNDSYLQKLTDNAPLHPNAAGQQQIAAQDAQAFKETNNR